VQRESDGMEVGPASKAGKEGPTAVAWSRLSKKPGACTYRRNHNRSHERKSVWRTVARVLPSVSGHTDLECDSVHERAERCFRVSDGPVEAAISTGASHRSIVTCLFRWPRQMFERKCRLAD